MSGSHTTIVSEEDSDAQTEASELKTKANALYRQGSFSEANDVYKTIIERYADTISVQLLRTIRCNRAACLIELGEFEFALVELDQIFQSDGTDTHDVNGHHMAVIDEQTDPIFQKAHFRKARCLSELGRAAEGLRELDKYLDLVHGEVDDAEPLLRAKILQSLTIDSKSPSSSSSLSSNSATSKSEPTSTLNTGRLPFEYVALVIGRDAPITLHCTAPAELFVLAPPREAAVRFVTDLAKEHDEFVMNSAKPEGWACWKCSEPATSLTHTPMMCLYGQYSPQVIDYVRPVCKNSGRCDSVEDRELMDEELKARFAGFATNKAFSLGK